MTAESNSQITTAEALEQTKLWFNNKIGNKDPLTVLLERRDIDCYCNLTLWHQASRLPPLYLALSQSCRKAITVLDEKHKDERTMLPTQVDLYLLRNNFLNSTKNITNARAIFGHDWREPCKV